MPEYLAGQKPTPEQLNEWNEFFHTNGFLLIHNVLTPEQCQLLRSDLDTALKKIEGNKYQRSKKIMKRMFEHSKANLDLFALEPLVTFAEHLIGGANGTDYSIDDGIPNANVIHVITITHLRFRQRLMDWLKMHGIKTIRHMHSPLTANP